MEEILFFDLEVNEKTGRIVDTGWLYANREGHEKGLKSLLEAMNQASYCCGHNVVRHDLPALKRNAGLSDANGIKIIDTLFLSALLFPQKPYHSLVKDYKLTSEFMNNPLEDARLVQILLREIIYKWHSLADPLRTIYFNLLKNEPGFDGFFEFNEVQKSKTSSSQQLQQTINDYFKNKLCSDSKIGPRIESSPVELAYALALIDTDDVTSIHPPWILHTFPEVNSILEGLRLNGCTNEGCKYCQKHLDPVNALKSFFGYPSFRKFANDGDIPLQQQVVQAALEGKSLLAVFPTGGGKSLTFQLPALIKAHATRALTVIISPLQSLMKDQVDNLRKKRIVDAVAITGLLSPLERAEAIERVATGGANLLYIAPESLRSKTIFSLLKKRNINRFVIDEAHCFSCWGQDFRVDYLYIAQYLGDLKKEKGLEKTIPVSCFTATAKPLVIQDINEYFKSRLNLNLQIFQTSVERKNLKFFILKAKNDEEKEKYLIDLIQNREGPKIVYVSRVKRAKALAELLQRWGFPDARAFYGDLTPEVKTKIQDGFMSGTIETIIATNAFGMGVDKDNVQTIIHYNISSSLENYIQEAGRAGRNPKLSAHCYVLYSENDVEKHFILHNFSKLSFKEITQIWQGIKNFKRSTIIKSSLEIAYKSGWDTDMKDLDTRVKTSISALEEVKFVNRHLNASRVYASGILPKNVDEANRIIDSHAHLFRNGSTTVRDAKRIIASLIKGKFKDITNNQADHLAQALELERQYVILCFQHFKQIGILSNVKDLSCFVCLLQENQSPRNSGRVLKKFMTLESAIFPIIFPKEEGYYSKFFLKTLLESLLQKDLDADLMSLLKLLQYWQVSGLLSKKNRLDATSQHFEIARKKQLSHDTILERHELAAAILELLIGPLMEKTNNGNPIEREKVPVEFSILDLQDQVPFMSRDYSIEEFEKALLYLHHIGSIELDKGVLIFYNPMTIERRETNNSRRYNKDDFLKLGNFYDSKTEQIHIIDEYVRLQSESNEKGQGFVKDYFELNWQAFLQKYFEGRLNRIKRTISERKYNELFKKDLSAEQKAVIRSKASRIFVAAGPGSGKTHVLIRKVAKLLLVEDTKPENFLMLTFSRPAAMEIKKRLNKLIGALAWRVEVFTFHSYAFQLLGRLGNLEKSKEIIPRATKAILEEEVLMDRLMSKSVLLIDEYQDIGDDIYAFSQAIIKKAGNIRVIAVGDDDQTIFEFAKANVSHMRSFLDSDTVKRFDLTMNFRARKELVEFSNKFLELFQDQRIKQGITLKAKDSKKSKIEIISYKTNKLVVPIVDKVIAKGQKGKIAILTRTNDEALLIHTCLVDAGKPSQLVAEQEGYQLRNIVELRTFTDALKNHPETESGFITNELWKEKKAQILDQFFKSQNLDLIRRILSTFEKDKLVKAKENSKSEVVPGYLFPDWNQYLHEIKVEHFASEDKQIILVSTMHKAKGKEFDHVILSLKDFNISPSAEKRLLYVAMTRARESLTIHTNSFQFKGFEQVVPNLKRLSDNNHYHDPEKLVFRCGMKDVNLNSMKRSNFKARVILLNSGDPLEVLNEDEPFQLSTDSGLFWISWDFRHKIEPYLEQGYRGTSASIANLVFWRYPEDEEEYLVVLPELVLEKIKKE